MSRRLLGILLLWGLAAEARAHLVGDGFGPFYGGFVHPFVTPEDVLAVLGLGLLAGTAGPAAGRRLLIVLPAAWTLGMLLAPWCSAPQLPGLLLGILTGVLVALGRPCSPALVGVLAGLVGLLHGLGNGRDMPQQAAWLLSTLGIVCAVALVSALVAGQAMSMRRAWMRIAMRVVGSWLAAIGLLMLGWSFHR